MSYVLFGAYAAIVTAAAGYLCGMVYEQSIQEDYHG